MFTFFANTDNYHIFVCPIKTYSYGNYLRGEISARIVRDRKAR